MLCCHVVFFAPFFCLDDAKLQQTQHHAALQPGASWQTNCSGASLHNYEDLWRVVPLPLGIGVLLPMQLTEYQSLCENLQYLDLGGTQ